MFALLINGCVPTQREFVVEVALNFVMFGSDWTQRTELAWAAPGEDWVRCRSTKPVSRQIELLNEAIDTAVKPDRCIVGLNCCRGSTMNVGDNFATVAQATNDVTVESTKDTAILTARRHAQHPLWFGWYHDEHAVDLVFVHSQRRAIEASTGRCGCLFDDKLQLWLMESRKLAVYELATKKVIVTGIDDVKEETASTES